MYKAAIIGVSGYGGGELARLLARHPSVELVYAASETYAGSPLAKAFPALYGTKAGALVCQHSDAIAAAEAADVVFLAQESGAAMASAPGILGLGKRVVDLSADFRLKDADLYPQWYKMPHTAVGLLKEAVYGMPELHQDAIKGAVLVANPGCHTTASILALAPLFSAGLVETRKIVVDSKTGVSGAGRSKNDLVYKFSEANESAKPYGVGGVHRHIPEIEQEIGAFTGGEAVRISFTPHLVPMTRGILATAYAPLVDAETTAETVRQAFLSFYADAPFVVVREAGDYPATKDTLGSNFCHLAVAVDKRTGTVIVNSVIDNLVKGAAGQAIQNMNLMLGLPETAGLEGGGLWP